MNGTLTEIFTSSEEKPSSVTSEIEEDMRRIYNMQVPDENERDRLLEMLGAALLECGDKKLYEKVRRLRGLPMLEIIDALSSAERMTTNADAHRLIATIKRTLTGKEEAEEFTRLCHKLAGTI